MSLAIFLLSSLRHPPPHITCDCINGDSQRERAEIRANRNLHVTDNYSLLYVDTMSCESG